MPPHEEKAPKPASTSTGRWGPWLPVVPGEPLGQYDYRALTCKDCGALVFDRPLHDAWHERGPQSTNPDPGASS